MFCSNCGYENDDNAKFCRKCGSPLNEASEPIPVENDKIPQNFNKTNGTIIDKINDNSNTKKILIACGLGVFLIICGIILAFSSSNSENNVSDTNHTTSALESMNFNVSDELQLRYDYVGGYPGNTNDTQLVYTYEPENRIITYRFSIEKSSSIFLEDYPRSNYQKINDTTYIQTTTVKNPTSDGKSTKSYVVYTGEYVQIGDEIYSILSTLELYGDNPNLIEEKDYQKSLDFLNYFNSHNNVKLLELGSSTSDTDDNYNDYDDTEDDENYDDYDDNEEDTQQSNNNKWTFDQDTAALPTA